MTRLDKLKELEERLFRSMNDSDDKTLPALARQYRETIKEIEEIEGANSNDDAVAKILEERAGSGKAGAVR
jgi:hypothetical protein